MLCVYLTVTAISLWRVLARTRAELVFTAAAIYSREKKHTHIHKPYTNPNVIAHTHLRK